MGCFKSILKAWLPYKNMSDCLFLVFNHNLSIKAWTPVLSKWVLLLQMMFQPTYWCWSINCKPIASSGTLAAILPRNFHLLFNNSNFAASNHLATFKLQFQRPSDSSNSPWLRTSVPNAKGASRLINNFTDYQFSTASRFLSSTTF